MELMNNFLNEYATLLLYTALTGIFGVIAAFVKKKYKEKCDTKTKKDVVKTCVTAVQQLYKDLGGEEKKQKAIESISEMLTEKGISISPLEMDMLIEAAVGEFKGVFDEEPEEDYEVLFIPDEYDDGEDYNFGWDDTVE